MLYYKNNAWHLCTEKVKYIQGGTELENHIGVEGKQWWLEFKGIEIIEIIDIVATDVQLARLEEINGLNIPDGFSSVCSDYVEFGTFPDEVEHKLRNLQYKKEQLTNDIYLLDYEFRISMIELGI